MSYQFVSRTQVVSWQCPDSVSDSVSDVFGVKAYSEVSQAVTRASVDWPAPGTRGPRHEQRSPHDKIGYLTTVKTELEFQVQNEGVQGVLWDFKHTSLNRINVKLK